jgi:hypothetical protein
MPNVNPRRLNPRVPWVEVLGKKQEEKASARQAYDNLGPYDVSMREIFIKAGKAMEPSMVPSYRAITRGTMPGCDDTAERVSTVKGFSLLLSCRIPR